MQLDFGTFRDFNMTATICDHAGWVVNIGDSPTNNGAGGDGHSFSNDAEITILDRTLSFWADDTHPSPRLLLEQPGFLWLPTECGGANFYLTRAPTTTFVGATGSAVIRDFSTPHMFRMGAPDTEGAPNTDFWVGLNRTILDSSRRGKGVTNAIFRFSGTVGGT